MNELKTNTYKSQVSDFVEAAAHDLHAPLRKLSVMIDRLFTKHSDQFSVDAQEYVKRINSCVDEMRSLVDGLTELAKADAQTITSVDCDLNVIVQQTLDMMGEEIEQKHAEVEIEHLPVVKGNYIQYKQLFKNLFENAFKFSNKNVPTKICVNSEIINEEEKNVFDLPVEKKYYKIEIQDNGIGFNQEHAKKIFEPFVRLHSKSEYEGSGLGLSICKKIVANHQGIIYAEGNENNGSRFILILPETH